MLPTKAKKPRQPIDLTNEPKPVQPKKARDHLPVKRKATDTPDITEKRAKKERKRQQKEKENSQKIIEQSSDHVVDITGKA